MQVHSSDGKDSHSSFPDYAPKHRWHAVATRADERDGRTTQTVFYASRGQMIAYTIVSGDPLAWPAHPRRARRNGTTLRYLRSGGRTVVAWLRSGRTRLLSATDVPRAELLELAAWDGGGAVSS